MVAVKKWRVMLQTGVERADQEAGRFRTGWGARRFARAMNRTGGPGRWMGWVYVAERVDLVAPGDTQTTLSRRGFPAKW